MIVQLITDIRENRAGFFASYSLVSQEDERSISNENYVLTLPSTLTVGKYSAPEKMCLQTSNLKANGQVFITVYSFNLEQTFNTGESTNLNKQFEKAINVRQGNELTCEDIKLKDNFPGSYALIHVEGDIQG